MRAAIALARQGSVAVQISRCHLQLASLLVITGEWDEALLEARVSQSIVADDHQVWMAGRADALLATIFAYRGDWEAAGAHLAEAEEAARRHSNFETILLARTAHAALARPASSRRKSSSCSAPLPALVPKLSGLFWWPALVSALVDAGQLERAGRASPTWRELPARVASTSPPALPGWRPGWRRSGPSQKGGLPAYERPSPASGRRPAPGASLDPPRATGSSWRRPGTVATPWTQLRQAHTLLAGAGAKPFLERVDADLAASGIRPTASGPTSTLTLTEREHDVALLVSRGLSNPEVGAQLYISRKAVEYHLANIYGKLGIKSRRELRGHALQRGCAIGPRYCTSNS